MTLPPAFDAARPPGAGRPRLAWFAPAPPPLPSAGGEVVRRLSTRYTIDVYVDRDDAIEPSGPGARSAHDFVWRHRLDPYDLTVFELADHPTHDFVWPYLVRYPGLVWLHDGRLHRTRAEALLREVRLEDYCAEFAYDHPDTAPDVPRLSIPDALCEARELWPMRRVVVESSRWLICPDRWLAAEVGAEATHARIGVVEPGLPAVGAPDVRDRVRHRLGLRPDDVVFASLIPETAGGRLREILTAFARLDPASTSSRLLLPDGVRLDGELGAMARALGLTAHVVTGARADELTDPERRAAADVCLCLQWPARSDGHQQWLACLAAGRATIIFDLADRVDIPLLDPRDGRPRAVVATTDGPPGPPRPCVAVAVDVVDESHSLALALRRLAGDRDLRAQLGDGAGRLIQDRFDLDRRVTALDEVIGRALATPLDDVRRPQFPPHLLADGADSARAVLRTLGLRLPWPWLDPDE